MSMTPQWVKRRTEMILGAADGTPTELVEQLDAAGLLLPCASTIPGGLPVTVRTTGLGVLLGADALVCALLAALAAESVADPEGVAWELSEVDGASGPERDELLQGLVERLGGATLSFGATAARGLAERLKLAAGPVFPAQRDRGAA